MKHIKLCDINNKPSKKEVKERAIKNIINCDNFYLITIKNEKPEKDINCNSIGFPDSLQIKISEYIVNITKNYEDDL